VPIDRGPIEGVVNGLIAAIEDDRGGEAKIGNVVIVVDVNGSELRARGNSAPHISVGLLRSAESGLLESAPTELKGDSAPD
jgi:hypothetical protein